MSIDYNGIRVTVHLENIVHNYRLLQSASGNVWPVVKSDAYGHGLAEVSAALAAEGADTFCVGTVWEGADLRRSGAVGKGRILCLLGAIRPQDVHDLVEYDLIPWVPGLDNLDWLASMLKKPSAKQNGPVHIGLKFDTGMARLGFLPEEVPAIVERFNAFRAQGIAPHAIMEPVLAASHLACADEPDKADSVTEQLNRFRQALDGLAAGGLPVEASLANTAAILGHPDTHLDAQRGGIALYGANPFHSTSREHLGQGLRPAMEVTAPILLVHDLKKGRGISYGHTYVAERDMRVAIVGAGYADGYSRGLSGKGRMCLDGKRAPILGRVCMQMTAVDVSHIPDAAPGRAIHLLGGQGPGRITPEDLAGWWDTISYEVFCVLGMNPRTHL